MNAAGPDALPTALVVVVARSGSQLPADLVTRIDRADPGLSFGPDRRHVWTDRDRRTLVVAWQRGDAGDRWLPTPDGLVVTTGRMRRPGARWTSPASWATELHDRLHDEDMEHIVDSLTGGFHLLAMDGDGRGTLAGDALGMAFTYHGSNDAVEVFASEAALVADVLAAPGSPPERDPVASSWLTYTPFHIGLDTGYAGVALLREGTLVRFGAGPPRLESRPAPWLATGPLTGMGADALIDRIITSIGDELQAAVHLDADDRIMDLTGGKDSRLMLAVALLAGLADRFTFTTIGPETLADVRVARQIAAEFDLDHHWGLDRFNDEDSYPDRARRFAEATSGTVSIWHAKGSGPPTGRVRVSGSFAEILRTHQRVEGEPPDATVLADRQVHRFEARAMPLLAPDLIAELGDRVRAEFTDDPVGGSAPLDLLETFFARNRTRKFWGPLLSMERDLRLWPLVTPDSVRAAFALGGEDRQLERVHHEIIRRASPELAAIPFAGSGWAPELTGGTGHPAPDEGVASEVVSPPPSAAATSARREEPLIAMFRRTSADDRDEFLRGIVGDHTNPAWSLIDRVATADALDRWSELPSRHRQQVYGALTAALWLGHHDTR